MRATGFFNRESLAAVVVALMSLGIGMGAIGGIESYAAESQNLEITERINVSNFDKITIKDLMNVTYRQGDFPGYVEVTALPEFIDYLTITEEDGALILGCQPIPTDGNNKLTVSIIAPNLHKLDMSGVTAFEVEGTFSIYDSLEVTAKDVAQVNFGEVVGNRIKLDTEGVAKVYILSAELDNIEANAKETSSMRLKGLNVGNINAIAKDVASITLGGRCRSVTDEADQLAKVNINGLIVETATNNKAPKTKTAVPREP